MTSPSKIKGSSFEREIVTYLRASGYPGAERTRAGWVDDRGDIDGVVGVTFECKNRKAMDLSGWVNELIVEMQHANNSVGAVIHKRRGITDAGSYYATLPLSVFVHLIKEAGY
jgi:hypothetical protein